MLSSHEAVPLPNRVFLSTPQRPAPDTRGFCNISGNGAAPSPNRLHPKSVPSWNGEKSQRRPPEMSCPTLSPPWPGPWSCCKANQLILNLCVQVLPLQSWDDLAQNPINRPVVKFAEFRLVHRGKADRLGPTNSPVPS